MNRALAQLQGQPQSAGAAGGDSMEVESSSPAINAQVLQRITDVSQTYVPTTHALSLR